VIKYEPEDTKVSAWLLENKPMEIVGNGQNAIGKSRFGERKKDIK
jgi:hypothetical protein